MRPGDTCVLRTVRKGRVRNALAMIYVGSAGDRVLLYVPPGAETVHASTNLRSGNLVSFDEPWTHDHAVWRDNHTLWLAQLDDAYSLNLFWNGGWEFLAWYIQLQDPMTRSAVGFDTVDHLLDVVVEPDGAWTWKDEDELEQAVALGLYSAEQAATARAVAKRVLADRPWPTGWEGWRPDPRWTPPTLPDGWDRV